MLARATSILTFRESQTDSRTYVYMECDRSESSGRFYYITQVFIFHYTVINEFHIN